MNQLKSAKNWLQYASIPLVRPTSIIKSVFCWPRLSTVPTAGHVFSAHAHNWPRSSTNTCMTFTVDQINAAPAALRLMSSSFYNYLSGSYLNHNNKTNGCMYDLFLQGCLVCGNTYIYAYKFLTPIQELQVTDDR